MESPRRARSTAATRPLWPAPTMTTSALRGTTLLLFTHHLLHQIVVGVAGLGGRRRGGRALGRVAHHLSQEIVGVVLGLVGRALGGVAHHLLHQIVGVVRRGRGGLGRIRRRRDRRF